MTGWLRDEARGRPISEVFKIINGAKAESVQNSVDFVLEQDKPVDLPPETILVRRDGSEVAIADTASSVHDWSGKLTGAVTHEALACADVEIPPFKDCFFVAHQ